MNKNDFHLLKVNDFLIWRRDKNHYEFCFTKVIRKEDNKVCKSQVCIVCDKCKKMWYAYEENCKEIYFIGRKYKTISLSEITNPR